MNTIKSSARSIKLKLRGMSSMKWRQVFEKKHHHLSKKNKRRQHMFVAISICCAALILVIGGGLLYILRDLPSPRTLAADTKFAVSSQIYDRNGKLLYEIFADQNRTPIKIDTLPKYVYQASVSIEDQNFYHHLGFDIFGIIRAARNTLTGKRLEGGSTITQQLVKNALLTPERSFTRKIKEIVLSFATELIYPKDKILEMYLNTISYGGTSIGIESASHRYFGKSAKDLSIAEAALLAGLPQSPTRYSPFGSSPEEAKKRQQDVLRRMREDGYITPTQEALAKDEVLHFALSRTDINAPHFVFYVRDLLNEKYGVDRVEKGGLRVTTTLDLDLQDAAQASLSAEVEKLKGYQIGNAAAMIVKPNTGEVLAMIGSKDYFDTKEDGQVNVALALRQPGSSIKPLMYATAFQEKILNPGSYLLDIPTCFDVVGQKTYCPRNYDGSFHGPVSVRFSLANSLNIPAVKSLRTIGLDSFINQAEKMGITSWKDPSNYGLSLTLGGGEVRMYDLAQAFSSLANEGVKVPFNPILKVEDYKGNVLETADIQGTKNTLSYLTQHEDIIQQNNQTRVLNRAPAYLVGHIMQDNNARQTEFGPHSKLVVSNQIVSAKTGTTNDLRDNWTVGFTPEFLTIAWVGNNDSTPMNRALVSGITGAAPIWNDIMSYTLRNQAPLPLDKPSDVVSAQVCTTGFPSSYVPQNTTDGTAPKPAASPRPAAPASSTQCTPKGEDLYWTKSHPSRSTEYQKDVWIHPETGLPLKSGEPTDGLQLQHKSFMNDPVTDDFCIDCVRALDPKGKPSYEQFTVPNDYVIQDGPQ